MKFGEQLNESMLEYCDEVLCDVFCDFLSSVSVQNSINTEFHVVVEVVSNEVGFVKGKIPSSIFGLKLRLGSSATAISLTMGDFCKIELAFPPYISFALILSLSCCL